MATTWTWPQRIAVEVAFLTIWSAIMAVIFYEPGIQRSTRYGGLLLGLYVGVRSFVTGMQWMWSMARKYNVEDIFVGALLGVTIFVCGIWQPPLTLVSPVLKPYIGATGFRIFAKLIRNAKREYKIVTDSAFRIIFVFVVCRCMYVLYRILTNQWDWGVLYSKIKSSQASKSSETSGQDRTEETEENGEINDEDDSHERNPSPRRRSISQRKTHSS